MIDKLISAETYELAKIYSGISHLKLRTEVLMRSKDVMAGARHYLKTSIFNRLNAITNDLKSMFPDDGESLDDMISDEASCQNENVMNMYLSFPKSIRNEIEAQIELRFNMYHQSKS